MENRYPLFAGGRILKKETLWDLRDYSYGSLQLSYEDYTDGILKGCRVRVEESELVISKGMLKYGDFIYLMQEEQRVPFQAENRMVVLKAAFEAKQFQPDYIVYQVRFFLDYDLLLQKGQMELCRFHLRTGSILRDTYQNFRDMGTEYDTINLIHATMAGRGQGRMHPKILMEFAKNMQNHDIKNMEDFAFCYHIFQNNGEIERKVLNAYFVDKQLGESASEIQQWEMLRCFEVLESILNNRGVAYQESRNHKVIYVE